MVKDFSRRKIRTTKSARELVFTFLVSSLLCSDDFTTHLAFRYCRFGVNVLLRLKGSSVWLLKFTCCHFLNCPGIFNPYSHFQRFSRLAASLVDYETIRQKSSLAALASHESFGVELGESCFVIGDHHFSFFSLGFWFAGLRGFYELQILVFICYLVEVLRWLGAGSPGLLG
jgi:hypothetical protein